MKKIGCYLYNIIFWISRIVTISIFGICFFAVLNAKYLISEKFFSYIMKLVYNISAFLNGILHINTDYIKYIFSLYTDPSPFRITHLSKYYIYRSFSINSQYIDILLICFVLIVIIFLLCIVLFKKYDVKYKYYKFLIISMFFVYIIFSCFIQNINFFILLIISLATFILINLVHKYRLNNKIIILFPIITEIFYFDEILKKISFKQYFNNSLKTIYLLIISLVISNIIYILFYFHNNYFFKPIIYLDTYNLCIDKKNNKIMISSNPIYVIDNNNEYFLKEKYGDIQDISFNSIKNEIYVYDFNIAKLYTLDSNTYEKINIMNIGTEFFARLYCDEQNYNLSVVFENIDCYTLLIDIKENIIKKKYYTESSNEFIFYNKFRDSYILSFHQKHNFVQEIKRDGNDVKNIPMESEQGYIAISEQNKEIYIAFHQQGRIGVYDAETMELKRKIKSNYTVKDITYDEELNVLIAPSYFAGYVDIFLMDGSDKLLKRKFVGYELREARFDTKKENLYVCSRNGLYKIPINIKKLIKESHKNEGVN